MPLFQMNLKANSLAEIAAHTLKEVGILERQNLQKLLRDSPAAINKALGEDLFIISEEFDQWECKRRVDLLALDKIEEPDGNGIKTVNLVIIELKRDDDGSHMELQAIRYAAMLAYREFKDVVEIYRNFTEKMASEKPSFSKLTIDEAQKKLLEFLKINEPEKILISKTPRIVLINSDFNKEITSTVLWLNDEYELEIQCLKAVSYKIDSELFLNLEKVIPLPEASAYMVQRREKTQNEKQQVSASKREPTIPFLVDRGLLKPNDRLFLIALPKANLIIPPEKEAKAKHATFLSSKEIRWDYDGNIYSLSQLCEKICAEFGYPDAGPISVTGSFGQRKEKINHSLNFLIWHDYKFPHREIFRVTGKLFRRIRAFEQRRRRDLFVEPNPNQIKVLANGHHLKMGSAGVPPAVFGVLAEYINNQFRSARRETAQPGRSRSPKITASQVGLILPPAFLVKQFSRRQSFCRKIVQNPFHRRSEDILREPPTPRRESEHLSKAASP